MEMGMEMKTGTATPQDIEMNLLLQPQILPLASICC